MTNEKYGWGRWLRSACVLAGLQLTAACDPGAKPDSKIPEAMDAPDACAPPMILLYTKPGCGDDVKPTCESGSAGACATIACNCKGETISGRCNGLNEKFKPASECKPDAGF